MWKLTAVVPLLGLCVTCGGSSGNAPPAQQPESKPSVASPPAEDPAPSEEPSEGASAPSDPPAQEDKTGDAPKKPCDVLDKATCKVTVGCVWHDVRKCVKE